MGLPFDARRAAELGLVTRVVPDQNLLTTATEVAWKLAAKPSGALRASKRLMKSAFVDQIKAAMALENKEYSVLTGPRRKGGVRGVSEKRAPDFNRTREIYPRRIAAAGSKHAGSKSARKGEKHE